MLQSTELSDNTMQKRWTLTGDANFDVDYTPEAREGDHGERLAISKKEVDDMQPVYIPFSGSRDGITTLVALADSPLPICPQTISKDSVSDATSLKDGYGTGSELSVGKAGERYRCSDRTRESAHITAL